MLFCFNDRYPKALFGYDSNTSSTLWNHRDVCAVSREELDVFTREGTNTLARVSCEVLDSDICSANKKYIFSVTSLSSSLFLSVGVCP